MQRQHAEVDYIDKSLRHKNFVRCLNSQDCVSEEWEAFYAEIYDYVTEKFKFKLREEYSLSVDDFIRGELTHFLRENNCERLCRWHKCRRAYNVRRRRYSHVSSKNAQKAEANHSSGSSQDSRTRRLNKRNFPLSIAGLKKLHNMSCISAAFTIDWIRRAPEEAIMVLGKECDARVIFASVSYLCWCKEADVYE